VSIACLHGGKQVLLWLVGICTVVKMYIKKEKGYLTAICYKPLSSAFGHCNALDAHIYICISKLRPANEPKSQSGYKRMARVFCGLRGDSALRPPLFVLTLGDRVSPHALPGFAFAPCTACVPLI